LKGIADEENNVSGSQVYRLLEPGPVVLVTPARAGETNIKSFR
jgi:hypothetical protein